MSLSPPPSQSLPLRHTCANHGGREAACRCPECRVEFCRECVLEHHGRFLCVMCLNRLTKPVARRPVRVPAVVSVAAPVAWLAFAVVLSWMVFGSIGYVLAGIPTAGQDAADASAGQRGRDR